MDATAKSAKNVAAEAEPKKRIKHKTDPRIEQKITEVGDEAALPNTQRQPCPTHSATRLYDSCHGATLHCFAAPTQSQGAPVLEAV